MSAWLQTWWPPLVWMAVIFVFSHQSSLGPGGRVPDWITHGAGYGALSFLVARAWGETVLASWRVAALIVGGCTVYGVTDEIHQAFVPGRNPDAWDVLKDFGGSVAGVFAFRLLDAGRLALTPSR